MSRTGTPPGLCGDCAHARIIESRRGSRFFLCRRSRVDASFPRYPRLPVLRCAGYQPTDGPEAAAERRGTDGAGPS